MDVVISIVVVVALVALATWWLFRRIFRRVTIFEFQRGLQYVNGRFRKILGPGRYWLYRPSVFVQVIDIRPQVVLIPGQEVISSDGVSVRISLAAKLAVADPAIAVNEIADYMANLYVTLQLGLRELVSATPIDDLLEKRNEIGARLTESSVEPLRRIGVELESVDVKDLMFPGNLKRIFAQVVEARQEGLAALEKARGETAALRNLGNAARLVEGSPALLQLRLLQQIASSAGNTIVLGMPTSSTPLPLREGGEPPPIEQPPVDVDDF